MTTLIAFGIIGVILLVVLQRVTAKRRCKVFDEETLRRLGDLADKEDD